MKKLFHDNSATWTESLNILYACSEIASMSRHVAYIAKIGECAPTADGKCG